MNGRGRWKLAALCALLALLCACGGGGGGSSAQPGSSAGPEDPSVPAVVPLPEPEPEPEIVYPYANPLTGQGLEEDISGQRPVAVMFNNLEKALPQLGVAQADVIYEIVAEGGITRLMGVYQDIEGAGDLGSIRSARDYYVSIACGHDAIYVHAGGSPQAYEALQSWGMSYIDFVNGPYGGMCWRDAQRRKSAGLEHSLLTSSQNLLEQMPQRIRREHREGFSVGWTFATQAPEGGAAAGELTVPFSSYKTGYFVYEPELEGYRVSQKVNGNEHPFVDGNTGREVTVSNVLVLFTDVSLIPGDSAGRMSVRTTGEGGGLLLRDGRVYELTWQRDSREGCYRFLDAAGQPLPLAVGRSYINLVPESAQVVWR